jgi:putative heme-binding domain-containing protein
MFRLILLTWVALSTLATAGTSSAQTLNEKLIAEAPETLVADALKSGDIVRGAILFHQGNINCAKCHRPASEKERIGPDLSRLKPEVTNEELVTSILKPSEAITEGYETTLVLTEAGESLSGIIVKQDEDTVVLRDGQNIDKLWTLKRSELEGIRPGKVSTMPADLANELKNRQQFLDLLRYVINIKDRGPSEEGLNTSTEPSELEDELKGLVLMQKHNCVACHGSSSQQTMVDPKQPPQLQWSAKHLNPEYLQDFIANPSKVHPGTTMPDLLTRLDDSERQETAKSISVFLTSKFGNQFKFVKLDPSRIQSGHELFHSVGCVACHSPRKTTGEEESLADSEPLGDISRKYNLPSLVEFLKDPHAVRPSGRMPNMKLTHFEATDLANFLLQGSEPTESKKLNDSLVSQGKTNFTKLNCIACHTGIVEEQPSKSKPLPQLDAQRGCLSGDVGAWPKFSFSDSERKYIASAISNHSLKLDNEQQISVSLEYFNCLNCHERGSLGGVSDLRNPHFQTEDMNLGEQGRIPPTLTGVGAKLKREWMRDVFVNRRSIRPYMKTRMPQYGESNVGHLIDLFQADQLPETKFVEFEDQKKMRETGHQLAGNKGLNCVACHTFQYKISDTMPAVDLTEMSERLKKRWFYQYMLDPQKFSANTVMPSFWPGGEPIRKDLEGSPEAQVEAIWQYLLDGRQARTPAGVVRERLEIVVEDEAKMLRRSYPEIGKRGIGVGYPGGINLAFDAEQMRLAMVWKGQFVDPGGVWTGQGSGQARPMGNTINFGKGPQLDSLANPWLVDDGRPPNHRFRGYTLDDKQQPTFEYQFENTKVQDFFEAVEDQETQQKVLRRTITVTSSDERVDLGFRIAQSTEVKQTAAGFKVGERLRVQVLSEHTAEAIDRSDDQAIVAKLQLNANEKQTLVIEYAWD